MLPGALWKLDLNVMGALKASTAQVGGHALLRKPGAELEAVAHCLSLKAESGPLWEALWISWRTHDRARPGHATPS